MTIGERLQQARQERKMTLDDVVRRTNIRPHFLKAIDDDLLGEIPESHRRLFVREYARAVGLDPAAVLQDLPEVSPAIVAPELAHREAADRHATTAAGTTPGSRISGAPGMKHLQGNPTMVAGVALLLIVVAGIYYFVTREETAAPEVAVAGGDSLSSSTEILSAPNGVVTDSSAIAPIVLEPGDSLTLEGRAVERVWYTIVADGKRSDFGTLDSGATKTWRAAEVFKVSLGNAGGLQLFLNERPLGTLGPRAAVVRAKLIDATGIRTTPRPAAPTASPGTPGSTPPAGTVAIPGTGTGGQAAVERATASGRTAPRASRRRTMNRTRTAVREISPTEMR